MKRIISMMLVLAMLMPHFLGTAAAAEPAQIPQTVEETDVSASSNGNMCGENLYWNLDDSGTLTISGSGAMTECTSSSLVPWYSSCEQVKSVVVETGVTGIAAYAFSGCSNLENVQISETVRSFGKYAFYGCKSLVELALPDSVSYISEYMFASCSALQRVSLPASLYGIENYAFSGCSSLETLQLPDTVSWIEWSAFSGCYNLKRINIPEGMTVLQVGTFSSCRSLESIVIPNSVKTIEEYALSGCAGLTSISIPSGVTRIEEGAFRDCSGLKEVTFRGNAPKFVGSYLFTGVTANCYYPSGNDTWTDDVRKNYGGTLTWDCVNDSGECGAEGSNATWTVSDGILRISGNGKMADYSRETAPWFTYKSAIKKIIIEDGITYIGDYAFYQCSLATSVEMPASVTGIGDYSFNKCTVLKELPITEQLTELGEYSFAYCEAATAVTIPTSVTQIKSGLFRGCKALSEITLHERISAVGDYAFSNCPISAIVLPEDIAEIPNGVFSGCKMLSSIVTEGQIIKIGSHAFSSCEALTSYTVPDTVTTIGNSAFSGCINLRSVVLPENLEAISDMLFLSCTSLAEVNFPQNISRIGIRAFMYCNGLTEIAVPKSVEFIGDGAFEECTGLKRATLDGTAAEIEENAFRSCSSMVELTVGEGVARIDQYAFSCSKLEAITFMDTVEIAWRAFYSCPNLTTINMMGDAPVMEESTFSNITATVYYPAGNETYTAEYLSGRYGGTLTWLVHGYEMDENCGENIVWEITDEGVLKLTGTGPMYDYDPGNTEYSPWHTIADSVKHIEVGEGITYLGKDAFSKCINAALVTLPPTLTTIGKQAFANTALTEIVIPDTVTAVQDAAFMGCDQVTSVSLPNTAVSYGASVFYGNESLERIAFPESMTALPNGLMSHCVNLQTVELPATLKSIGAYAFAYCYELNSLVLPEGLETIGEYAFTLAGASSLYSEWYDANNFTSVTLPSTLKSIGTGAFCYCESLSSVQIPKNITTLENRVFDHCRSLSSIVIPANITEIKTDAFMYCSNLKKVTFEWTAPIFAEEIFFDVVATCYYPSNNKDWTKDLLQDYQGTLTWVAQEMEEPESGSGGGDGGDPGDNEGTDSTEPGGSGGNETEGGEETKPGDGNEGGEEGGGNTGGGTGGDGEGSGEGGGESGGDPGETGGTCGTGLTWHLEESTGTLTISGSGGMLHYTEETPAPWKGKAASIRFVEIGSGVTAVGNNAFSGCTAMETITFAGGAPSIGEAAFADVSAVVYYPIEETTWTAAVKQNYGGSLTWVPVYGEHKLTDWAVFSAASCTEDGEERAACRECEFYLSRVIEAPGHSYIYWAVVRVPSCEAEGEDRRDCVNCDHYETRTVPAAGHTEGESVIENEVACDCLKDGSYDTVIYCTVCDAELSRVTTVVPATGHSYETVVTEPTCMEQGYTTHTCTACGDSYVDSYVDALGHTVVIDEAVEASCKDGLTEGSHCSVCGTVLVAQEVIPAVAEHSFAEGICQVCGTEATAHGSCGTNVSWALSPEGTLYIYGSGDMTDYSLEGAPWYAHRSEVLEIVIDPGVTKIGDCAFMRCSNAVSASIPEGVTSIGARAFVYCNNLLNVEIPESVTSINGMAFSGCSSLAEIIIPESVTSIGQYAFENCSLASIIIPSSVTRIEPRTFWGCGNLAGITLPETLTSIGEGAFYQSGLTSITIPNGVTDIGKSAFAYCESLATAVLPDSITSIGKNVFYCSGLTSITIPNSVTSIGESAFYSTNLNDIVIPERVTSIGESAFIYCYFLKSITLPEGLTSIGENAFASTGLISVKLPDSVRYVGDLVFYNSRSLTDVVIPAGVTSIPRRLFGYCSELKNVTFCGNAPAFAEEVFYGCTATVYYPRHNATWTEDIMQDYGGNITWVSYDPCEDGHSYEAVVTEPTCVEQGYTTHTCTVCGDSYVDGYVDATGHSYGEWVEVTAAICTEDGEERRDCVNCDHFETQVIPAVGHTEVIDPAVEASCKDGLTEGSHCSVCDLILIAQEVIPGGEHVFRDGECVGCGLKATAYGTCGDDLTWMLVDGILTISGSGEMDNYTFDQKAPWSAYCETIIGVVITEGVTSIGDYAFYGCSNLVTVTIPKDVVSIGGWAFCTCSSLASVTIPEGVISVGDYAFFYCSSLETVTIPEGVTTIGGGTFKECRSLTAATIPESVTSIGPYAFQNCRKLETVTLPEQADSIGMWAFYYCSSLKAVRIPEGVTKIDNCTFAHCDSLETVTIPEGVTIIGDEAFDQCSSLAAVTIPESVTSINFAAFRGCSSLKTVTIPDSVTAINDNAFVSCSGLETVTIGKGVTFIGRIAISNCKNLSEIIFEGNAPATMRDSCFGGVTATVYYHCDRAGWTDAVKQNYGGNITWKGMHNYEAGVTVPGCTEQGYTTYTCTLCGDSYVDGYVDANGHSYTDWTVVRASSCEIEGEDRRDCVNCEHYETRTVPATGHTEGEEVVENNVDPDCVKDGSYETVVYCIVCDEELSRVTTVVSAKGHDYESVGTVPTCTDQGYITHTCIVCGDSYVDSYVDALGHTVENGICVDCETVFVRITAQPVDVAVEEGALAEIVLEAEGEGLTYAWYFKNATGSKFSLTTAFTGPVYSVTMSEARNGRQVYCVITDANGYSVTTDTVTMTMATTPLKIIVQPEDVTVADGETAAVTVEATGDGLTYTWYYKNKGAAKFSKTTAFKSNIYSVTMSLDRDGRQVYCVIADKYGNEVRTETATLTMEKNALVILQQPEDVEAANGKPAVVTVEAAGDGLTYSWYYKNSGASKFTKTTAFKSNTYSVTMSLDRDGRQVYCVIADKYGNELRTETVTLTMEKNALVILQQPADVEVEDGEVAEVTVEATGDGLTYTWYYKNPGSASFSKTTAFTGPAYAISMSAARNGRQVYCIVKDRYGNEVKTDVVTLSMCVTALEIVTQPEDVMVAEDETAEVTVEAVGDGLTYEWYYKNAGSSQFTKTSTFTGPSYSLLMNASRSGRQVYCRITDCYGNTVQTETVVLTMETTPLEILTQPEGFTIGAGKTGEIYVEAMGDGLTYEWYYKNATSSKFTKTTTFTGPEYSLTMNASRSGRHVYCVITDKYGNSVQTDIVTLNMVSDLELLNQTEDVAVANGETAVVTAEAVGENMTYTWYYRNEGAAAFTKTTSFTGDTYSLKMTAARNGRQVYCVIQDGNGNIMATNIVTLSVIG